MFVSEDFVISGVTNSVFTTLFTVPVSGEYAFSREVRSLEVRRSCSSQGSFVGTGSLVTYHVALITIGTNTTSNRHIRYTSINNELYLSSFSASFFKMFHSDGTSTHSLQNTIRSGFFAGTVLSVVTC